MTEPTGIRPWLLAARPKTLTASVAPVLVGTALASGLGNEPVAWPLAVVAFVSATFIQIGTNLVTDAADFERGADTKDRLGPIRVTQTGLLTPRQVKLGAAAAFAIAALLGIPLLYAGGLPILIIGVLSILAGYAYTTGPAPLAYVGLGEVFVLLFFGLAAVKGTVYVVAGQGFAPWEIAALVLAPFAVGTAWLAAGRPLAAWLPLLALPLAAVLVRRVWTEEPSVRFNQHLALSALLQLVFAVLLSAGLVL